MEVGTRQGVCNDSPAEWAGPRKGWRPDRRGLPGGEAETEAGPSEAREAPRGERSEPARVGGRGGRVGAGAPGARKPRTREGGRSVLPRRSWWQ